MLALGLSALIALADPAPPQTLERDGAVHETVTDAGLRIWSFPDDGGDRFLLMVLVGAGARHEDPAATGVAHLLEHVVLASTTRRSKEEANRMLDELGGAFNGYTSHEVTTYYVTCSSRSWRFAVDWLAEHVVGPGFDPVDFAVEQEIVYEEIDSDQPHAGTTTLEEHLYPNHPLGRSIGGNQRRIRKLSLDDLHSFYDRHYRAPNMAVGFSGRVPEADVVAAIRAAFAELPDHGDVAQASPVQPRASETILSHDIRSERAGWVMTGYHMPAGDAVETAIQLHLGEYLSTRLFEEVRERRQLSYGPGAAVEHYSDTARIDMSVEVSDRFELPTVMQVIDELVAELRTPDPVTLASASRAVVSTLHASTTFQLSAAMELSWLMRRAGQSPMDLQTALVSVDGPSVSAYSAANLGRARKFAIASSSLGGRPSPLWGIALGLLALMVIVDGARGFRWLGAARALPARLERRRRQVRTKPAPPLPTMRGISGDDLERSIQDFYAEQDRQQGEQP